METSIIISGQIQSVSTLTGAIETNSCKCEKLPFNNYKLTFRTKKEAVIALSAAYRYLSSDKEDWKASMGGYHYGCTISYDAASAIITE